MASESRPPTSQSDRRPDAVDKESLTNATDDVERGLGARDALQELGPDAPVVLSPGPECAKTFEYEAMARHCSIVLRTVDGLALSVDEHRIVHMSSEREVNVIYLRLEDDWLDDVRTSDGTRAVAQTYLHRHYWSRPSR